MIKTLHESSLNILYLQDTQNETQFPEKSDSGEKPVVDLANYRAFFRYEYLHKRLLFYMEYLQYTRNGFGMGVEGGQIKRKLINVSCWGFFFFRELDISVFTILHTGLITKSSLDTELNTKVGYYNYSSDIQSYKC